MPRLARDVCQDTAHLERAHLEVDILPLKTEEFSTPHTRCQGQEKQRFLTVPATSN